MSITGHFPGASGTSGDGPSELSLVVTQLLKGVVYRDTHEKRWSSLLSLRAQVNDYMSVIGLRVIIDESEGYAYLKGQEVEEGNEQIPRLVARRTLSFHVSLLLALLRKKLAEFDASSADTRLVLSRDQIVEMVRIFLPESSNEARLVDQIDSYINKVIELGFLRRLSGARDQFELRRIIKAYVDGQWLADFEERLGEYRALLGSSVDITNTSQTSDRV